MEYFQRARLGEWSRQSLVANVSAVVLAGNTGAGHLRPSRGVSHTRDCLRRCVPGLGTRTKDGVAAQTSHGRAEGRPRTQSRCGAVRGGQGNAPTGAVFFC